MAPYPWHFGGQRFQNLFLSSSDIVKWANLLDLRVCLDTSTAIYIVESIDYDFYQFVEEIGQHVAYLHLADAKGLNGEGLQVGEGEIDFHRLSKALSQSWGDRVYSRNLARAQKFRVWFLAGPI